MSEQTTFTCDQCGFSDTVPFAAGLSRGWLRISTLHSKDRGEDIDTGYSSLPPIDLCSWACLAKNAEARARQLALT